MEHPRLISVAEKLVPNLLKPKSKTGSNFLTKVQELKAIQRRDETDQIKGKIDSVGQSQEAKAGHMVNQQKQKQMGKESVQTKPGKIANGKTENRIEVEKTATASAIGQNKQAKTKGECDFW